MRPAATWTPEQLDDLVRCYRNGESALDISKRTGIGRGPIRKRLVLSGVPVRGLSESQRLRALETDPETRKRNVLAANIARRGQVVSQETLIQLAKIRQAHLSHVSHYETALADLLKSRHMPTTQQLAIGPYNCDLAAAPVAVEVFGGNWDGGSRNPKRALKRLRYILDAGWHVLMIRTDRKRPITPSIADYVVSYVKETSRDKSRIREYRVIRST